MKLQELLAVLERIMRDTSPRSSYYAMALREHFYKNHKGMLDEEVKIE